MIHLALVAACLIASLPHGEAKQASPAEYLPTASYAVQNIEGWSVLVNPVLLGKESDLGKEALKELDVQLYEVARHMPGPAVEKLRKVKLWVEVNDPHIPCATYHPDRDWLVKNGMNPDMQKCVEISNAATFVKWTLVQPSMIMHELSHAYHDQFVDMGFDNPDVKRCYDAAVKSGTYDAVWQSGATKKARAYALNNQMEYFAEASQAYYGIGDWYPFNRLELRELDPEIYKVVEHLWSAAGADARP